MLFRLLLLSLGVSAGVLQERQFGAVARVAGIDKLEPQLRKTAQRTLTKFGRTFGRCSMFREADCDSLHTQWSERKYGRLGCDLDC
jgi:hypothetical protein